MKTARRQTNALAATRARFGLTQPQMAQHLGISTSLVKQIETNRRFLSTDKLVKLAALEIQLGAMPKQTKALPPSIREIFDQESSNYALEANYEANRSTQSAKRLEKKLKKMEYEFEITHASVNNLDALIQTKPDAGEAVMKALLNRRQKLVKKLINCSPLKQAMLRKKIVLLHAEAALNKSIHPRYDHTNEKPTPIISPLKQPTWTTQSQ